MAIPTPAKSILILEDEAASRYLNGRTEILLKKWKAERGRLTAEKSALTRECATLKEEVRDVETIRKYAEGVGRAVTPRRERCGKEQGR
jgi:hypothetical protein